MTSPARLRFYVATIAVISALSLLVSWVFDPMRVDSLLILLLIALLASESLPVSLPSGSTISVSSPLLVSSVILLGPTSTAVLAALASALTDVRSRPPLKTVFNAAQFALSTIAASWVFHFIAEALIGTAEYPIFLSRSVYPGVFVPVIAFVFVVFALNTLLVGIVMAMAGGTSLRQLWLTDHLWQLPTQLGMMLLGVALAQAMLEVPLLGIAFFGVPLLVARAMILSYMRRRAAYADTIRSLVATIEAKDSYTRGHSERVAAYSVQIAKALRWSPQRIERLELAALLHDLGKIVIDKTVLQKEGKLSEEEWERIRRHPEVGARIAETVPYLNGIGAYIRHHHERVDGTGYGDALKAADLPLEARILAVADSYDAMTSRRPYRPPLTHHEAQEELLRSCDSQFDSEIVRIFISTCVDSGGQ